MAPKTQTSGSGSSSSPIRSLLILECFTARQPRLSMSDIQKTSGMPKSTVFRLLKALTERNYLKYDPERRQYHLGPRVLSLGFSVLQNLEAREIARPYLERLSREFERSVSLLMLDNNEMVFVERIRVPAIRDFSLSVGSRIPVYNTASGKAVLAFLEPVRLNGIIEQLKKTPAASPFIGRGGSVLRKALAEVRNQGFAVNDQESARWVRGLAVPVFSSSEIYALTVVVAPEEVSMEELRRTYAPRFMEVSRELSEAFGYQD